MNVPHYLYVTGMDMKGIMQAETYPDLSQSEAGGPCDRNQTCTHMRVSDIVRTEVASVCVRPPRLLPIRPARGGKQICTLYNSIYVHLIQGLEAIAGRHEHRMNREHSVFKFAWEGAASLLSASGPCHFYRAPIGPG